MFLPNDPRLLENRPSRWNLPGVRWNEPDAPSIYCPACGRRSWHPEDIRQRYCGACHQFHDVLQRRR